MQAIITVAITLFNLFNIFFFICSSILPSHRHPLSFFVSTTENIPLLSARHLSYLKFHKMKIAKLEIFLFPFMYIRWNSTTLLSLILSPEIIDWVDSRGNLFAALGTVPISPPFSFATTRISLYNCCKIRKMVITYSPLSSLLSLKCCHGSHNSVYCIIKIL